MPKKKPPKEQPPSGLDNMPTKDLFRSIRNDLAEQARKAGLAQSEDAKKPPKQRPSRS